MYVNRKALLTLYNYYFHFEQETYRDDRRRLRYSPTQRTQPPYTQTGFME